MVDFHPHNLLPTAVNKIQYRNSSLCTQGNYVSYGCQLLLSVFLFFFILCCLGVDYHFYRLDDNGLWSQKLGQTAATNHDGDGNLISDPRTAVNLPFGPDYKFVSFMMIFTNIIDGPLGPHPSTNE